MSVRYTPDHEWLRVEENGEVTVGITEFAAASLGDVVFVQLPSPDQYAAGAEVVVLESVKAASNIAMPFDGEVVAVNNSVEEEPEQVNASPMNSGWFFRFVPADSAAMEALMDDAAYQHYLKQQG